MRWRQILVGLLLVHGGSVDAQDRPASRTYHYFGYEPGYIQLKESNLIPKPFGGMAHSLIYGFERAGDTYRSFQFLFAFSSPETRIERDYEGEEDYTKINGQFHFQYSYDPLHLARNGVHLYLGPRLSYTHSLSYLHGWDSHAYWGNFLSLGSSGVARIDMGEDQTWQTVLNLSLAGFYSRPDLHREYKVEDWSLFHILKITNERYAAGFWDDAFQMGLSTEYRFALRGARVALGYSSYYSRIARDGGRPLQESIHRIIARIVL